MIHGYSFRGKEEPLRLLGAEVFWMDSLPSRPVFEQMLEHLKPGDEVIIESPGRLRNRGREPFEKKIKDRGAELTYGQRYKPKLYASRISARRYYDPSPDMQIRHHAIWHHPRMELREKRQTISYEWGAKVSQMTLETWYGSFDDPAPSPTGFIRASHGPDRT